MLLFIHLGPVPILTPITKPHSSPKKKKTFNDVSPFQYNPDTSKQGAEYIYEVSNSLTYFKNNTIFTSIISHVILLHQD